MCIDYTNLNKIYLNDSYPLAWIDQLVDITSRYKLLTFMDAFLGNNQIQMTPHDREHTSFITDHGVYYYEAMSFGLKNDEQNIQAPD